MADIRLKLRNVFFRLLNEIDNNNNTHIDHNGEARLLRTVMNEFEGEKFVLFDVGANVGEFSQTALLFFRQIHHGQKEISIHAFEPLPLTFTKLNNNLNKESCCMLVNKAISESEGIATIYYDEKEIGLTSLHNRNEVSLPAKADVSLMRLDTYLKETGIGHIDFLKLDTEGHELSALKSAGDFLYPKFVKAIQFEYGGTYLDSRIYLKDIYLLLHARGYEIYKIYSRNIKKRAYHPAMENFQYSNFVALAKS